ncbi:MAG: peptide chain release factor 1 [bacterium]|nr:peptide chain release factor 1 [bacterium]
MDEVIIHKFKDLENRFNELNKLLTLPDTLKDRNKFIELSQEYNELSRLLNLWRRYSELSARISDDERILCSQDEELKHIAKEEIDELKVEKIRLETELLDSLVPKDQNDSRSVIMEIRQGAGGDESSIFARDLFRMYSKYAERQGWQVEILSSHPTSIGGFKEIIYYVKGEAVYGKLKYESGVHRVQRIPITESGGRIHTSTATVCVLPEALPIDIKINPDDIKLESFRARGHGGQNVNKVSSAVRLTHIPTNTTVVCQDERSQYQNRVKAMKILLARVYELERRKRDEKVQTTRRQQIGEGERAEKIRTYNYPQQRVTDHRINITLYKLDSVLDGELDPLINELKNANSRNYYSYSSISKE